MSGQEAPKKPKVEKATFNFTAEKDLIATFKMVCQETDMPAARVMRQAMREYIAKHRQGNLNF